MLGSTTFTLLGVPASYYAGKIRAYLRHKNIPFVEQGPGLKLYFHDIPKRTGAAAIPVVITPEGEWLQDSSLIIDRLEQRFPESPVVPADPRLRIASYLFELWGDEFWVPLAMHARWSHVENLPFYGAEIGAQIFPWAPRWLQRKAGLEFAKRMITIAGTVGVGTSAKQDALIERWAQIHLDALNVHFSQQPYLFGERPSLGDFGLIGPLFGHLGRDPWPLRELIAPRPHLAAWIKRMQKPDAIPGEFRVGCLESPSLQPALQSIFTEMLPFLQACGDAVSELPVLPPGQRAKAPRYFGHIEHPMAGGTYQRPATSYPVWMGQRLLHTYHGMPAEEHQQVQDWLASVSGQALQRLVLPPVERVGLTAAHAPNPLAV